MKSYNFFQQKLTLLNQATYKFILFLYVDRNGNIFMQLATNRNIREYFLIFKRPSHFFTDHVHK